MSRTRQVILTSLFWSVLGIAVVGFLIRDLPGYATYTPEAYDSFWDVRGFLIPHLIGAGLAILIGLAQFSNRLRAFAPRVHRVLGYAYVAGCSVGAPAALGLAVNAECVACRPALGSLSVYWFAATMMAFLLARRRLFVAHRAFMIRSFVAMNVFVIVRIAYIVAGDAANVRANQAMIEYLSCFVPLLLTEMALSWRGDLKKLRT